MQGLGNPNYMNSVKPKTLMCYICGREYGTMSLPIHLKSCQQKFLQEESKKPKAQRRPLPQAPEILGPKQTDIEAYNQNAFQVYNQECLEKCVNCGRTFKPEALVHHAKACTAEKPFKPLDQEDEQAELAPCCKCGRKFLPSRLEKHEAACKEVPKPKKKEQQQKPIEYEPVPVQLPQAVQSTQEIRSKTPKKADPQEYKQQTSSPQKQSVKEVVNEVKQEQKSQPIIQYNQSAQTLRCFKCLVQQQFNQLSQHTITCRDNGIMPRIYNDLIQIQNPSSYIIDLYHSEIDQIRSYQTQMKSTQETIEIPQHKEFRIKSPQTIAKQETKTMSQTNTVFHQSSKTNTKLQPIQSSNSKQKNGNIFAQKTRY